MSITLPIPGNRRIELRIEPWAIAAADGDTLREPYDGLWHTALSPMYSHPNLLHILGGKVTAGLPDVFLRFAIFEASLFVDGIVVPTCDDANQDYFCAIRQRYVTLRALLNLLSGYVGPSQVIKKVLGDFEIQYSDKNGDGNLMSRLLNELAALDPVVRSGGCLGIGADHPPVGVTKGAWDPYKPVFGRTNITPSPGESGVMYGRVSPGFGRGTRHGERWYNAGSRYFGGRRR